MKKICFFLYKIVIKKIKSIDELIMNENFTKKLIVSNSIIRKTNFLSVIDEKTFL